MNSLWLLAGIVTKFFTLLLSFGLKVPGGIFVPSLCLGSMIGQFVGTIMLTIQQAVGNVGLFVECQDTEVCIIPGVYALIGAATAMAGITRITVCIVVILFERE